MSDLATKTIAWLKKHQTQAMKDLYKFAPSGLSKDEMRAKSLIMRRLTEIDKNLKTQEQLFGGGKS